MAITAWLLAGGGIIGVGLLLGPRPDLLLTVLGAQAAVALPVAILASRLPLRDIGMGPCAWRPLLGGLAITPLVVAASIVAGMLVVALAGRPPSGQPVDRAIADIHQRLGWGGLLLLTAVLPGLVEEALFRGIVLHGLRRRMGPWPAIIISALAFACLHLSPWRLLPQFALGCILGWLTLRCGSCWPAAMAHIGHNAALVVVARLAQQHLA